MYGNKIYGFSFEKKKLDSCMGSMNNVFKNFFKIINNLIMKTINGSQGNLNISFKINICNIL